ncbi:MAG: TIGR01212 family radical SAM protein [Candidatus Omnitrophota bacterium]
MSRYYYSFNQYLQEKFKQRVHRLSLDAGFSCPNIDGNLSGDGCLFCNNKAFSRFSNAKKVPLESQIIQSMDYAGRRFGAKKFIAYFQSFTNTYADSEFLSRQYNTIRKFDDIVGLAISTRPDCIDEEKLDIIESFAGDYAVFIEYGLQSVHDKTLRRINRNHAFIDFQRAITQTVQRGISIGVHVILGLPGENKEDMLETARQLSGMPLWGIKFHCLHVVKDTALEELYDKGAITLLCEDKYINILVDFIELIPKDWVILRLISDSQKEFLVGPEWINNKPKVLEKIEEEFVRRKSFQGYKMARPMEN